MPTINCYLLVIAYIIITSLKDVYRYTYTLICTSENEIHNISVHKVAANYTVFKRLKLLKSFIINARGFHTIRKKIFFCSYNLYVIIDGLEGHSAVKTY